MPRGKSDHNTEYLNTRCVISSGSGKNCRRRSITYAVNWEYRLGDRQFRRRLPWQPRPATGTPGRPKRVLSAAARRRIAAAQRKRWAEHRKNLKPR